MRIEGFTLVGTHVLLEPLDHGHLDGLVVAAATDPPLYKWSPVPQSKDETASYISTALAWRDAGTAIPFATIREHDGVVIGSTRFWNLENWAWPQSSPHYGRHTVDICEIGYTWLTASAIRTAANTEAKLLMLTHAFETWNVLGVYFHTDARNKRSAAALERIGGRLDGVLRSHRMAADFIPRDSLRYSILAAEWPEVKKRLCARLGRG